MNRYNILQDVSNQLQKSTAKSKYAASAKFLGNFRAFEITKKVEFYNQSPIMVATLLETEITGKDGAKSNVWEAMDKTGNLKKTLELQRIYIHGKYMMQVLKKL